MRQNVTMVLLFASLALAIWIFASPSAGSFHDAFTHYDQKSMIVQAVYTGACIILSFAGGSLFRRKRN